MAAMATVGFSASSQPVHRAATVTMLHDFARPVATGEGGHQCRNSQGGWTGGKVSKKKNMNQIETTYTVITCYYTIRCCLHFMLVLLQPFRKVSHSFVFTTWMNQKGASSGRWICTDTGNCRLTFRKDSVSCTIHIFSHVSRRIILIF